MPKSRFEIVDGDDQWSLGETRGQYLEVDSFSPVTFLQTPTLNLLDRSEVTVDDTEHENQISSSSTIVRLVETMGDDALSRGPLCGSIRERSLLVLRVSNSFYLPFSLELHYRLSCFFFPSTSKGLIP